MSALTVSVVLLLIWTVFLVQRPQLVKRRLKGEVRASLGLSVLATAATIAIGLGIKVPSVLRALSFWFFVP
jgi:hypothetical protein